jgi:hypothetical protein
MHKLSADVSSTKAALLGRAPGHVTFWRLPNSESDTHRRRVVPVTMQALKRAKISVKAYRSMEYRMYSSFITTLRGMQQDTYTEHHQVRQQQQQQQQYLKRQQEQQQEALAQLRGAWRRVSSCYAPKLRPGVRCCVSALRLPQHSAGEVCLKECPHL